MTRLIAARISPTDQPKDILLACFQKSESFMPITPIRLPKDGDVEARWVFSRRDNIMSLNLADTNESQ